MKAIPIAKVRALSEAAGGRGAILLVFDGEGNYSGASYGDTRPECKELGRLLDEICDGLGRVGVGALHTPRIGRSLPPPPPLRRVPPAHGPGERCPVHLLCPDCARIARIALASSLVAADRAAGALVPAGQCGRELAGGWLCVRAVGHAGDCRRVLDLSPAELAADSGAR